MVTICLVEYILFCHIFGTRNILILVFNMQKTQTKNVPHIVLNDIVNLEALESKFEPILQKGKPLIKINDMFIHHKKHTALFSVVIIDELHQEYFIEVSTRELKTTIRLLPLTDPQKTDAVKKSLVLVFDLIKKHYPSHKITKTTLQNFIPGVSII